MTAQPRPLDSYLSHHAAQLPVLGVEGQQGLKAKRVHISGCGRIGSACLWFLHSAGVGAISINDPQTIEPENIGPLAFTVCADLGQPKVDVLGRFLQGRPYLDLTPLVRSTESLSADVYRDADLVISCANTVSARLAAEREAVEHGKPVMQVAAADGRNRLAGQVSLRLPENEWSACFGCLLSTGQEFPRGEGLLATATSSIAAVASNMAIQLLTNTRRDFLDHHNVVFIDLESYVIEALAVNRRTDCDICGGASTPSPRTVGQPIMRTGPPESTRG